MTSTQRHNTWLTSQTIRDAILKGSFLLMMALLTACASTPPSSEEGEDIVFEEENVDKFEGFNRAMFSFNDTLDRWILKPVAKGYDKVLPRPVKTGVGNFFSNLGEVTNVINDILQWKWKQAGNDTGRFLMNSTVGVFGIFDVARKAGLEKSDGEDFGQTLAHWGVPQGPYLVLPFLGPSTIRETGALPVNWYTSPVTYVESDKARIGATALDFVHTRAGLLSTEELASGDFYLFVRDAYLQRREYLNNDGEVEDDFGGDDFGDEFGDGSFDE